MTEKVLEWVRGVSLIDLDAGAGVEGFTCVGKELSKSDQSITTDLSDRVPSIVGINEMDYCTDQDTIKVTAKRMASFCQSQHLQLVLIALQLMPLIAPQSLLGRLCG